MCQHRHSKLIFEDVETILEPWLEDNHTTDWVRGCKFVQREKHIEASDYWQDSIHGTIRKRTIDWLR